MSLLEVHDLKKSYVKRSRPFWRKQTIQAVRGVSFSIDPGETLALVGESGCGKTTVARSILRLVEPTSGMVMFDSRDMATMRKSELREIRHRFQVVFQDPYRSLNPRISVLATLREAASVSPRVESRDDVVEEVLELVGLDASFAYRFPHELSGGQRQRVAIARALACRPELVILDEPVTALDVSIRAGILRMLLAAQKTTGVSYLLIAHDLDVVRWIANRVAVMYMGEVVEVGLADEVLNHPRHPYTKALTLAVPVADPVVERAREKVVLHGELPSPLSPPQGCKFRTRCYKAQEKCAQIQPILESTENGTQVACHFPEQM